MKTLIEWKWAVALGVVIGFAVPVQAQNTAGSPKAAAILAGAKAEAQRQTPYIMEYEVIKYPGGDVTTGTGVCTDLVVRALRNAGIDLQKAVSEDMRARSGSYPKIWDNKKPDRNIDHRRCPNLVVWLRKYATELPKGLDGEDMVQWQAGDIVFYVHKGATHPWHVGVVSDKKASDGMPYIIDAYPPHTSESHRLDDFAPIHSHFRVK